jgi:DMSO/TMAO reductase YedYZ heme-binding membrane subunit
MVKAWEGDDLMKKISTNTLGVIIGLVVSVLWIFIGLDFGFNFGSGFDSISYLLTLGGYRHTIIPIACLILIPICAQEYRWGFSAAMALGIVTLTLASTHVIYMLIVTPFGYESLLFGPIVWSIIQAPIILFSYRARKELNEAR